MRDASERSRGIELMRDPVAPGFVRDQAFDSDQKLVTQLITNVRLGLGRKKPAFENSA